MRVGRAVTGDRIMSGQTLTRRAAIAACGAFALVTAMPGGSARAQSRVTIGPNKDDRAWDNISGVAMVGGVARPVRATSRYWASAIDQVRFEQSNHARVSAVAQALAYWIARDL